jgi:hypothetical protein
MNSVGVSKGSLWEGDVWNFNSEMEDAMETPGS